MTRALTDDLNSGSTFSCSFMIRARNSCGVANLWALHACSTMRISRDDAPAHEWRAAAREWRSPPRPERIAFTWCRSVRAESTHAEPQGNGAGLRHAVPARLEASDYTVPQDDPLEVLWGELIGIPHNVPYVNPKYSFTSSARFLLIGTRVLSLVSSTTRYCSSSRSNMCTRCRLMMWLRCVRMNCSGFRRSSRSDNERLQK